MNKVSLWLGGLRQEGWFERLRGEVVIVLLSRMANAGVGFAFVVITARHLGPTGRGEIAVAFTIAWATASLANLGTPTSGRIRLLRPADPVGIYDVMSLTAALLPLQAFLAVAAVAVISLTSLQMTLGLSAAVVALSLATMLFNSVVFLLYGLRRYREVLVVEAILGVFEVAAVVGLLLSGHLTTTSAVLTMAIGSTLGSSWLVGRAKGSHVSAKHRVTTYWSTLISEGFYPMLGDITLFIALRFDRLVLATVAGADSLGLYVVALAIPETLRILPKAFGQVVADRGRSGQHTVEAVRRHGRLFVAGHFLVLGAAALVGSALLPVVCGEGFRNARDVLVIVTIAEALLSVHLMHQVLLVGFGRPRAIGLPQIVGGAVMVALDLVMIPEWGLHGAAWASVIGYAALATTSVMWTNRELLRIGA